MFTRTHYRAVAEILKETKMPLEVREALFDRFAAYFKADNSAFSRDRFADAVFAKPGDK